MRKFIKWLFKGEFEIEKQQYIAETKQLLEDTKNVAKKEYIDFEFVPVQTDEFIYGIHAFCENKFVLSWLQEHKSNHLSGITQAMIANNDKKVLNGAAGLGQIEILLSDLGKFAAKYKQVVESKKAKKG